MEMHRQSSKQNLPIDRSITQPASSTIAVVIPTLNEQATLARTLSSLHEQSTLANRIVVVDGGSTDHTLAIAQLWGVELVTVTNPGRGSQIVAGLQRVREAVVVISHADMIFPPDALSRICRYMEEHPRCPGGSLGHRFDSNRWIYRVIEWFDARRARHGYSYGDQAQFFRPELLAAVGGFPSPPIMEDVELAACLRRLGKPGYLNCPVTVSPRRFEQRGILRTLWQNWQFRRAYRRDGTAAIHSIYHRYYSKPEGSATEHHPQ
jgi:rSAM/selenodomain-associated transferase 2